MRQPKFTLRTSVPATLVVTAVLLAACSSGGNPKSSSSQGTGKTTTTTTASATSTSTTTPAAPRTGPLQLGQAIPIPITANEVTAAEAPNGAVFVSPQDPLSTSTTVVSVIDGNGPAQVAETMPSGVAALAADNINLYVGSYANVTAFNRSTGNKIGTWPLQEINTANSSDADLVTMSASGGHVFVMESQGNIERVYRFSPGSKAFPQLIAKGTSAAFGPNGSIYYARSDGHLVERTNSGATIVGPLLANAPNGEGGGVQYVTAVANGLVWVSEPAGQGLDTQFSRYDATTLKLLNSNSGTVSESIVGTSLGALVLSPPAGAGNCPQTTSTSSDSCVYQAASDGTLTNSTSVGMAITLLGPQAVVIGNGPTPTAFEMQRISSTS